MDEKYKDKIEEIFRAELTDMWTDIVLGNFELNADDIDVSEALDFLTFSESPARDSEIEKAEKTARKEIAAMLEHAVAKVERSLEGLKDTFGI